MAYIEVEVDLSEFDSDDIIREVAKRFSARRLASISDRHKKELKDSVQALATVLGAATPEGISIKTIDDQMKFDHFVKVFNKYSASDFETMIPE